METFLSSQLKSSIYFELLFHVCTRRIILSEIDFQSKILISSIKTLKGSSKQWPFERESSNSNNKIYISYLSSLTFTQMHNFQLITGWYSIDDK